MTIEQSTAHQQSALHSKGPLLCAVLASYILAVELKANPLYVMCMRIGANASHSLCCSGLVLVAVAPA